MNFLTFLRIGRIDILLKSRRDSAREKGEEKEEKKEEKEKPKWNFLQKYYHPGDFYHDKDDEKLHRDDSALTLEDKPILPKVMQVKNFGRSGRTKWTHLVDEDTTSSNKKDGSLAYVALKCAKIP